MRWRVDKVGDFLGQDGKLRLVEGVYKDTKGREILVFEDDEDEWEEW